MAILGFILSFIFLAWMTVVCVYTILFLGALGVASKERTVPIFFLLLSFVGWYFLITNAPFSITAN